jgi:hypothetical protein
MIVAVCSDKGSPGVSTLAVALGLVWPGQRAVVEADPSGGVLGFRLRRADSGEVLNPDPSIASVGAVARLGLPADGLTRYTQPTMLGVPVVPGPLTAERFTPLRSLWPQIAAEVKGWSGTAITDLGRLQPGNAAVPMARAATAVLLLARADLEGLFQLRERAGELAQLLGDVTREVNPVAVVVTGPPKQRAQALRQVTEMLTAAGSPVPVAGFFAHDPAAAAGLWQGQVTRRLAGSELVRSARDIAETVIGWWPQLAAPAAPPGLSDGEVPPVDGGPDDVGSAPDTADAGRVGDRRGVRA